MEMLFLREDFLVLKTNIIEMENISVAYINLLLSLENYLKMIYIIIFLYFGMVNLAVNNAMTFILITK